MKEQLFLIVEKAEDFEQPLGLDKSEGKPVGGVLEWSDKVAVFTTRRDAVEAIERTEHYRLAFKVVMPEKKYCVIRKAERSL